MAASRFHIIFNLKDVPEDKLMDQPGLTKFLLSFPQAIDMNILGGPVVTHGFPGNPGLSGFVLIDFSHISIHTFSDHKQVLVDIFSCKAFNQEAAIKPILDYFQVPRESTTIETVSWE